MKMDKFENFETFDRKKSELTTEELREKYREFNKNFKTELAPTDGGYGEKRPDRKIEALEKLNKQTGKNDAEGIKERYSAFYKFNPEKEIEKNRCEAGITTIDSVSKYFSQKIDISEMARNIAAATENVTAEARVFITEAVAENIRPSVYEMIESLRELNLPEEVISAVKECFESVVAFAEGKSDIKELGYDLADLIENILVGQFGKIIAEKCGGAWGFLLSLALETALDKALSGINPEDVQAVAEKMQEFAKSAIDAVASVSTEGVGTIRKAINTFFEKNGVQV